MDRRLAELFMDIPRDSKQTPFYVGAFQAKRMYYTVQPKRSFKQTFILNFSYMPLLTSDFQHSATRTRPSPDAVEVESELVTVRP